MNIFNELFFFAAFFFEPEQKAFPGRIMVFDDEPFTFGRWILVGSASR